MDCERVADEVVGFVSKVVEEAGAAGVVVGLSGGVDSSLVAAVCVRALGKERVLGVIMPAAFTPQQDVRDAHELADWLGIRTEFVSIQDIGEAFFRELRCDSEDVRFRMPMANVRARIRMVVLYYFANLCGYLVVGTGDRSEALIGFFTKYGDGGADFQPIRHLYKTQARELAKYLDVPDRIACKPSSPQLYPGHRLLDEVPLGYDRLDPVLVGLFDRKLSPKKVSELTGVSVEAVEEVLRRFKKSEHKRRMPKQL